MFLMQIVRIVWARKWIGLTALVSSIAVAYVAVLLLPARFEGVSTVLLEVGMSNDPVTGQVMGTFASSYQHSLVRVLQSDRVALDVVDDLKLADNPAFISSFQKATGGKGELRRWIAGLLDQDLTVGLPDYNNVMEVRYRAPDPRFAATVCNAFVRAFIKATLDLKVTPAQERANWYDAQVTGLRKDVEAAQAQLAAYQKQTGIFPDQGDADRQNLKSLSDRVLSLQSSITALEGSVKELDVQWPDTSKLPKREQIPAILAGPTMDRIKGDITGIEAEIAKNIGELGPNNPRLQALRATLADEQRQLLSEFQAARAAVLSRIEATRLDLASTQKAYDELQTKLLAKQAQQDQIALLQKEISVKQTELDSALSKSTTLKLEGQASSVDASVIDQASVPVGPIFPNKSKALLMAIAGGMALGLALAFLVEALDRRVRSPEDLAFAAQGRSLGIIIYRRQFLRWRRRLAHSGPIFLAPPSATAPSEGL
jgi:uncharacterized protein involved in exopolysaccharide biosynthesis